MKQKNKMESTKCPIERKDTETLLPSAEQIESIYFNERSSVRKVERLSLNQTNMNLNKIEELLKPDNNNSLCGSNDIRTFNIIYK